MYLPFGEKDPEIIDLQEIIKNVGKTYSPFDRHAERAKIVSFTMTGMREIVTSRVPKSVGAERDFALFRSSEQHMLMVAFDLIKYDFLLMFHSSLWNRCQIINRQTRKRNKISMN